MKTISIETIDVVGLGRLNLNSGITEPQILQLIEFTNHDPEVIRFTSDKKRFANREAFSQWQEKGRTIYTLVGKNDALLGIVWFGAEKIEEVRDFLEQIDIGKYGVTFAVRLYGEARGRGLAQVFIKKALSAYRQTDGYRAFQNRGIWLETDDENIPAKKAYEKVGFRQITNPDKKNRILMVL